MPSKSKSQQRLFGIALAVRRGELKRSDVYKEVLDIVDSEMTDREIEDFAKERTSNKEHNVSEAVAKNAFQQASEDIIKNAVKNTSIKNSIHSVERDDSGKSPLERYLNRLQYAGRMTPIIDVKPDFKYIFVVVKPGFTKLAQNIIDRFEENGFKLYKLHSKKLSLEETNELYDVHKNEDFYDALCQYMSSDISIGILFTYRHMDKDKAFEKVSEIKDTIRKEFSESDMRNVLHSSDNLENMRTESAMYFNELL